MKHAGKDLAKPDRRAKAGGEAASPGLERIFGALRYLPFLHGYDMIRTLTLSALPRWCI